MVRKVAKKKTTKKKPPNNKNDVLESLRKEYEVCFNNWRFFVGLRFTVLAFFLTLNSGLLYAYFNMFSDDTPRAFLLLPPFVGLSSMVAAWMIESRNKKMYYACIQRAKRIEEKLGHEVNTCKGEKNKIEEIPLFAEGPDLPEEAKRNSIGILLDNRCPVTPASSQTDGIRLIYIVLIALWLILFSVAVLPEGYLKTHATFFWDS